VVQFIRSLRRNKKDMEIKSKLYELFSAFEITSYTGFISSHKSKNSNV